MDATGPNAEQIRYWNETAGPKWVTYDDVLAGNLTPLGERTMDAATIVGGEHVLDVGCGCGATTLTLARRVGPTGRVTGADVSAPMLAKAAARAREANVAIDFLQADAQHHAFPAATFDLLYSRFGVMFFADPTAAFANLRRAMRPGGRLAFVCWQAMAKNPWLTTSLEVALRHVPPPPPPAPNAPGPFAFADADRLRGLLDEAGWRQIDIASDTNDIVIGGGNVSPAEAAHNLANLGPAAMLLRDAAPDVVALVRDELTEVLRRLVTPAGIRLGAAAWIVTGRAAA